MGSFQDADAQRMLGVIRHEVDNHGKRVNPQTKWGYVTSISTAASTCDVTIFGDTDESNAFMVPRYMFPEVGMLARVTIEPNGYRYLEAVYPTSTQDPSPIRARGKFVGGRVYKSSTQTLSTLSQWDNFTGFDDVLSFYHANWNVSGNGAIELPNVAGGGEFGLYLVNITGRFINATSGQRYGLGVYTNLTGGSYVTNTAPSNFQIGLYSTGLTANHYMSHTFVKNIDALPAYFYPLYWQSSSTAHTADSVLLTVMRLTETDE